MPHVRLDERPLSRREWREASQVSARAFFDDPFFIHLMPRDGLRLRGLELFFGAALKRPGPSGRIVTARDDTDRIVGVSLWLPPGAYPQSIPIQLAGIPATFRALYRRPRALVEGNRYMTAMAQTHRKEPHWYLYLLVADTHIQRQGVGSLLLAHGLAMVDDEAVGSYLETQKEDNIAYYRRFGYELYRTLTPVADGPPLYTMWREPRG